jgi:hypothetical protein
LLVFPVVLVALALVACASVQGRGRVALRCADPDAEVEVDGVPYGVAADYAGGEGRQLLLASGTHRIVVRGAAGGQSAREVAVGPEDSIAVAFDLPAGTAKAGQGVGPAKAIEQVRGGVR